MSWCLVPALLNSFTVMQMEIFIDCDASFSHSCACSMAAFLSFKEHLQAEAVFKGREYIEEYVKGTEPKWVNI